MNIFLTNPIANLSNSNREYENDIEMMRER